MMPSIIATVSLVGLAQPPVTGRLQVWAAGPGFELRGLRASELGSERLTLTTGMPLDALRRQVESTPWQSINDRLAQPARTLQLMRRSHRGAPEESIEIEVNRQDDKARVRRIAYAVQPVRYTSSGLARQLRAAFGEGDVLASDAGRLRARYPGRGGAVVLEVDAVRISAEASTWQVRYVWVDSRFPVVRSTTQPTASAPAGQSGPAKEPRSGWRDIELPPPRRPAGIGDRP